MESAPVLIIEDYEPVAELERRALVRSGLAVRVVGRIGDAIEVLQKEPFSAILLDYQLPDGDPWSIVELAGSRTPRIPVIIVTAMGNERVAAEAIHRGVVEYVRKTGTFYEELPGVVARVAKLARSEERVRRSDALLDLVGLHGQDMITTIDAKGVISSISNGCRGLLGYEPEELIGTPAADLAHPDDRGVEMLPPVPPAPESRLNSTVRCRRKDGTWVWVETNFYVTRDPTTGAPAEILAVSREAGQRKKAEERARALEASLRVSEARTKVMLEVISSLLGLQAMHVADAGARDALAESRSLVQAIALLHEKLCRSADLAHVGFDGYARDLVESLSVAHAAAERQISAAVDAEPLELAVDKALPCGLILNELVGNALKHAFPAGRAGSVRVSLRRTGPERVELQVGDDGVGLPADLDPAALGHGLVFTLARRLGAEVDIQREKGTAIVVRLAGG